MLPLFIPMKLINQPEPFSDPSWLYEVKYDGFRCLAYIDDPCRPVSRNGNTYSRFKDLAKVLADVPHKVVLDGEDLRSRSCIERKQILRDVVESGPDRLLYVDHIEEHGTRLYEQICQLDIEGIVAKPKDSVYADSARRSAWIKIKNPDYSQEEGRGNIFQQTNE